MTLLGARRATVTIGDLTVIWKIDYCDPPLAAASDNLVDTSVTKHALEYQTKPPLTAIWLTHAARSCKRQ